MSDQLPASTAPTPTAAAASLTGLRLEGGWLVGARLERPPSATGGIFSHGYEVEHTDGRKAFLKALDYSAALGAPNTAEVLNALTSAYLFECSLLEQCAQNRMSNVVLALSSGQVTVPGFGQLSKVNYITLERGQHDVRQHRDLFDKLDIAWCLRALHNVANGLRQLHSRGISHQDLKPSNIVVFSDHLSKIGDLGRASQQGRPALHDEMLIPGDRSYAAPELLYGQLNADIQLRRRAADMYQLGSICHYFFTGVGTTGAIAAALSPSHIWGQWTGSYTDVLPYVRAAFDRVASAMASQVPSACRDRLVPLFRQLCDPDTRLRGDPKDRPSYPYSLERYVSHFNVLARNAELSLKHLLV